MIVVVLPDASRLRRLAFDHPPCPIADHDWAEIHADSSAFSPVVGVVCQKCGWYPLEVLDREPVRDAALDAVVTR